MSSLIDILQRYGIPYKEAGSHHHVTQGWVGLDCPKCSKGSGRYRLGFNLAKAYLSCWTCGYAPLAWTLCEITGESYPEIKRLLKGIDREERREWKAKLGGLKLPDGLGALQPAHEKYLRKRGFNPDEIARVWGIQGIGFARRLPWRIWIPIHQEGQVVTWTTRSLADDGRRYINARPNEEAVPIKQTLYGEDHCRHAAIVVEGPTDAWRIGPGAVATFGVVASKAQVQKIARFPIRTVCFDKEPAAQRTARRLCRDLAGFPGETHNVILDADDPGSAGQDEVNNLRRRFLE